MKLGFQSSASGECVHLWTCRLDGGGREGSRASPYRALAPPPTQLKYVHTHTDTHSHIAGFFLLPGNLGPFSWGLHGPPPHLKHQATFLHGQCPFNTQVPPQMPSLLRSLSLPTACFVFHQKLIQRQESGASHLSGMWSQEHNKAMEK